MKLRSKVSQASWKRLPRGRPAIELGEVVLERQVLVGDPFLVAHRHQPLDQVLELADVARPPVRGQDLQRRSGDALDRSSELRLVAIEEEPRELRQILDPIAQRRHADRDHVDPVVEILAEPSFLDRLLEIDVGRRDQPEVGLDRLRSADALDLAFLDGAQQLGLQLEPRSPISSRNSVPPVASSNFPSCCLCAPVNAPRSWPNSVLSTSSCGIADS